MATAILVSDYVLSKNCYLHDREYEAKGHNHKVCGEKTSTTKVTASGEGGGSEGTGSDNEGVGGGGAEGSGGGGERGSLEGGCKNARRCC